MTDDKSVSDDRLREIISLHQGNNLVWPPHVVASEVLSMASELLARRSPPSGYRLALQHVRDQFEVKYQATGRPASVGVSSLIEVVAILDSALADPSPKEGK